MQSWFSAIDNSPKCINYRLFKSEFKLQKNCKKCKTNCITLCRYRTTNHKLPIETGRWNDVDRSDRICTLCNSISIADEFHYLFNCKYFENERRQRIFTTQMCWNIENLWHHLISKYFIICEVLSHLSSQTFSPWENPRDSNEKLAVNPSKLNEH